MNSYFAILASVLILASPSLSLAKNISFAESCAGAAGTAITLKAGQQAHGNATTAGHVNDLASGGGWICGDPAPGSAPDVVTEIDLVGGGVFDVSVVGAGFTPAFYLRTSCVNDRWYVDNYTGGAGCSTCPPGTTSSSSTGRAVARAHLR